MSHQFVKYIDVEKVIRQSSNPKFRNLPSWIIRLIEKIIKQDELNRIINKYREYQGMDFIQKLKDEEFKLKIHYLGSKKFDPNRKYVYVANHPLGGIDGIAHLTLVYQRHGNVKSPSNAFFNYVPNLRPLILGVNVFGQNNRAVVQELNNLFASDYQIMMFPAGEVSRIIGWTIQDPPWKKTYVTLAVRYKRDIVPSFISGHSSWLFLILAKLRKLLGIKVYLESVLLPAELFRCYGCQLYVYTLDPISWEEIANSGKSDAWWNNEIRSRVYNAKKLLKQTLKNLQL